MGSTIKLKYLTSLQRYYLTNIIKSIERIKNEIFDILIKSRKFDFINIIIESLMLNWIKFYLIKWIIYDAIKNYLC